MQLGHRALGLGSVPRREPIVPIELLGEASEPRPPPVPRTVHLGVEGWAAGGRELGVGKLVELLAGAGSGRRVPSGRRTVMPWRSRVRVKPPSWHGVVVEPAQQGQLVQVGDPRRLEGDGVVGVGPVRRRLAAREGAALVLEVQGAPLAGVGAAAGPADADHLGRPVHPEHGQHVSHRALPQQPLGHRPGHGGAVGQEAAALQRLLARVGRATEEIGRVPHQRHRRPGLTVGRRPAGAAGRHRPQGAGVALRGHQAVAGCERAPRRTWR